MAGDRGESVGREQRAGRGGLSRPRGQPGRGPGASAGLEQRPRCDGGGESSRCIGGRSKKNMEDF